MNKSLNKQLAKAVTNYNNKIARINRKTMGSLEYMPQRASIKDIKRMNYTDKAIRQEIKRLNMFNSESLNKVNYGGITMSKYQADLIKYNRKLATQRLDKEFKEFEDKMQNDAAFRYNIELNKNDLYNVAKARQEYLNKSDKDNLLVEGDIDTYINKLEKYSKLDLDYANILKENYLENLTQKMKYYPEFKNKGKVFNILKNMSGEEFYNLYNTPYFDENGVMQKVIEFNYQTDENDLDFEINAQDEIDRVYALLRNYEIKK